MRMRAVALVAVALVADLEAAAVEVGEMVVVAMAALHTLRTHGRPLHCRGPRAARCNSVAVPRSEGLPSSSHGSSGWNQLRADADRRRPR